jgi:hypothetical protein
MALTALNMAAFTVTPNVGGSPGPVAMLGLLKTFGAKADNDQVDAAGLADRYELAMNVKQGQTIDFTTFLEGSAEPVLTNLDVSLWELGGTNYLGSIRSGKLEVTTVGKESSGIASAYKSPSATRTSVRLTTQKLVLSNVAFVGQLISGTVASFDVAASVTWGTAAFVMPMTIKSAKHTVAREEMQFEEVVCVGKGSPTGPSDNSLLGNILLGAAQVALAIDTGGGQYDTGSGMWALITKLTTEFADANCIEQTGQFVFQGPATFATG